MIEFHAGMCPDSLERVLENGTYRETTGWPLLGLGEAGFVLSELLECWITARTHADAIRYVECSRNTTGRSD